jgi:DNA-binding MarR family transcriptional regulator
MLSPQRAAWYHSVRAQTAVLELMDEELRDGCGYPLAFYDVLIEIWRAPGHSLRMSELAGKVLLSRSWVTRRVAQLERAGLLEREPAAGDDRGVLAVLTPTGAAAFKEMERIHARSVRRHFSSFLTAEQAALLAERMAAIGDSARARLDQERDGRPSVTAAGPPSR